MTILHSLVRLHDRLAADGLAPEYGFSREKISYAVVLSPDGTPVDVGDLRDTSTRKPKPSLHIVPRPVKRTGQPESNFLWDKTSFALGVGTVDLDRAGREHAAFQEFHRRLLARSEDEGALAFLRFLDRWRPEHFRSLRYADDMPGANVVFRMDGTQEFLHARRAIRDIWLSHLANQEEEKGLCLVTGERAAVARLHPSVKGVDGAQSSGASLVSFNQDAFVSFGKKQGANSPVSERAASQYATALNTLLERKRGQRIRIGDATVVFWADAARDVAHAAASEKLISRLLDPPTDEEESVKVRDQLEAVAKGRPLRDIAPRVDPKTHFCVLGLSPNAARVSIRFWYRDTIEELACRIHQHWCDLRLEPTRWRTPAAWRLLRETAPPGKEENIPPIFMGGLMRAILGGGRYPRSLFAAVVGRMRADKKVNDLRAAICKACLVREKEAVPVGLSRNEANPAYRLGRLFCMYERVQQTALGKLNETIKDRYYGAASATPASVFPLLTRKSANHLATIRKDSGGLALWFDKEIDEIFAGMNTEFPRSLRLEDQGRFAIGYHHQRQSATKRKTDGERDNTDTTEKTDKSPTFFDNENES